MTGSVGIPGPFRLFLGKEKVHGQLITEQRAAYQEQSTEVSFLKAEFGQSHPSLSWKGSRNHLSNVFI